MSANEEHRAIAIAQQGLMANARASSHPLVDLSPLKLTLCQGARLLRAARGRMRASCCMFACRVSTCDGETEQARQQLKLMQSREGVGWGAKFMLGLRVANVGSLDLGAEPRCTATRRTSTFE
jgi:hypothetical protein